ncbi:hypothetical protein MMPV_000266 [Pyropia vietnamensis]
MGTFMRRLLRSSKKSNGAAAADESYGAPSGGGGYAEEEPRSAARSGRHKAGAATPHHAHAMNGHYPARSSAWSAEGPVGGFSPPEAAPAPATRSHEAGLAAADVGRGSPHEERRQRHGHGHSRGHEHGHGHGRSHGHGHSRSQSRDDAGGRGGHGADGGSRSAPRSRHHPSRRAESNGTVGATAGRRTASGNSERSDPVAPVPGTGDTPGSTDGGRYVKDGNAPPGTVPSGVPAAGSSDALAGQDGAAPRRRRSKRHSRGQSRDLRDMPVEDASADARDERPVWGPATVAAMAAAEMQIPSAGEAGGDGTPGTTAPSVAAERPPQRPPSRPSAPPPAAAAPRVRYSLDERRPSTAGIVSNRGQRGGRNGGDGDGGAGLFQLSGRGRKGETSATVDAKPDRSGRGGPGGGSSGRSGDASAALPGAAPHPRPPATGVTLASAEAKTGRPSRRAPPPVGSGGRLSLDGNASGGAGGASMDRAVAEVEAAKNRRLSVDGDLPLAAQTPHERSAKIASDGLEGVWLVEPAALLLPISLGACSKAGWEPVRDGNRREVVEVRKENQDAFCAHGPFSDHSGQIMVGVFDGHGAEGRGVSHFVRDTVPRAARELYSLTAPGRGGGDDPELALTTLGALHEGYSHSHGTARRAESRRADVHRARAKTLKAAFLRSERALTADGSAVDHVFSGTTAVVVWLHGADLYSACVGDSRAIIGRRLPPATGADGVGPAGPAERFHSVDTTWDQKPSRADERKRVKSAGGRVARWRRNVGPLRVWKPTEWLPGLAMTRSIGDTVLSPYGVQPVPEVSYIRLCRADSFLVLASDGVWEFMSSQEVATFVGRFRRSRAAADEAADALVREAVRRWRRNEVVVDDTTAVVVWIEWERDGSGLPAAVAMSSGRSGVGGGGGLFSGSRSAAVAAAAAASREFAVTLAERPLLVNEDGKLVSFPVKNDVATTE